MCKCVNIRVVFTLMRKICGSIFRVYRFLYEINQHMLKAVEMVTWLDADTLPQKSPSIGNNKASGKKDNDKEKEGEDRAEVATAADDVDNISIGSKSALSKNSAASMMKSMLPLPSFRQRHQCPFEVCACLYVCALISIVYSRKV